MKYCKELVQILLTEQLNHAKIVHELIVQYPDVFMKIMKGEPEKQVVACDNDKKVSKNIHDYFFKQKNIHDYFFKHQELAYLNKCKYPDAAKEAFYQLGISKANKIATIRMIRERTGCMLSEAVVIVNGFYDITCV